QALMRRRADAEQRIRESEKSGETASRDVGGKEPRLQVAAQRARELRREIQELGNTGREFQARLNKGGECRQLVTLKEQLETARTALQQAEQMAGEHEELKRQARARPAPDDAIIRKLEENRTKASQSRADLEAAAIALTLIPEPG